MTYKLTKDDLMLDLYAAFQCAKRHKANKMYVRVFERDLKHNIEKLCNELFERKYVAEPSSCFIVEHPKKREVFAAQFRDRVVHHLYYNYTHVLFERTFIQDSYSCVPNRGTHYGIERMKKHILQESENYTKKCYALQLDKRGYFMHIDRKILLQKTLETLERMRTHKVGKNGKVTWEEWIDFDFVKWLTKEIVMLDPKTNCKIVGSIKDWEGLDRNKSLFYTDGSCGLPIGNLTSQLLSNVYLNSFDQFVKRTLHCKHYGRYVDDSYIISKDKKWLVSLIPKIQEYLQKELHLELHMGKLHIIEVSMGVSFLGAFVKPYRTYINNASLSRSLQKINAINTKDIEKSFRSINSLIGVLCHYDTYNIRCKCFLRERFLKIGKFDKDITKFNLLTY